MASVDSGVETSNDSVDSSVTTDQQSAGPQTSKSKEIILYQVPPIITNNSFDSWMADANRRTGEETLHFRCPILPATRDERNSFPLLPAAFTALPLSPKNDYLFSSDLTDCKRNFNGSYKIRRGNSPCCSLKRGTRLHVSGGYYERKLRVAVMSNNIELVQNLLWIGVNPNSRDSFKRTPLHLAACRGYADIVRLLLDNNADPNQRDLLGNTPLHLAACTNNVVVVTLLLKAGTDVKSTDDFGRNPLQIAQSKLKLLHRLFSNEVSAPLKNQVYQIIEMLREFLNRRGQDTEAELISAFSSRLTLSKTRDQVETQVRDLLASLPQLSLDDKNSGALSNAAIGNATLGSAALSSTPLGSSTLGSTTFGSPSLGNAALGSPSLGSTPLGSASLSSAALGSALSSCGDSNPGDVSANSVVPAIDTGSLFQAGRGSGAFSLRSAWWGASSIDSMCNCHLETCRACRSKGLFSATSTAVPPSTSVSSSGFEPSME